MARVLVVEDDKSMNDILVSTLTDDDHEVVATFSGPEAVEACKTQPFDLLITDVRLPGTDGVETIGELRQLQPRLKCIVITGYAKEDTPVRAIRANVDDYLFKPFSLRYFLNSVERVLDSEREKKKKRALFSRLFARFGLSMGDDNDQKLVGLVQERQETFRGLYVGVRSKYLSQNAASELYTSLEALENTFRRLLNDPNPETDKIFALQEEYMDIHERLALHQIGASEEVQREALSLDEFSPLYNAIRESEITFEELLYAPLLRKTPDQRFETLAELLELKRKLWPTTGETRSDSASSLPTK